jgi:hypothetical protein
VAGKIPFFAPEPYDLAQDPTRLIPSRSEPIADLLRACSEPDIFQPLKCAEQL